MCPVPKAKKTATKTRKPRTIADVDRDQAAEMEKAIGPIKTEGEHRSDPTSTTSTPIIRNTTTPVVSPPSSTIPTTSATGHKSILSGLVKSVPVSARPPHVVVIARAGTGKTTTLVEGLKVLKGLPTSITPSPQQKAVWDAILLSKNRCRSVCFAAFNKSIAEELKKRVPAGCDASTLHSMGFSAVRKKYGREISVKENRVEGIICRIVGMAKQFIYDDEPKLIPLTRELVSLCKVNLATGAESELDQLCSRYDIEFREQNDRTEASLDRADALREKLYDLVPKVLTACRKVEDDLTIDYDDMIWIPVVNDLPIWRNDLLLVDEFQDTNKCQQALAKRCGDRLIVCGDDKQAIYGFAGADSDSIPNAIAELKQHPNGCVVLPLTVTRRCGKAIVEQANRYVSDFQAHESNGEGMVKTVEYPSANKAVQQDESKTYLPHVRAGDMIVCRSNAPLVGQCFKLLKRNVPAYIVGKADVAQSIISLITKMDASDVPSLIAKLEEWAGSEAAKENAKSEPNEAKLERIADRKECAIAFTEDMLTVPDVIRRIEKLFTVIQDAVRLSSVHRAKGLESERVFFLAPNGFRPRHPRTQEWEWQQELNLRYVGITRAIKELYYVF